MQKKNNDNVIKLQKIIKYKFKIYISLNTHYTESVKCEKGDAHYDKEQGCTAYISGNVLCDRYYRNNCEYWIF